MNPKLFLKLRRHTTMIIRAKLSKKKVGLEQKYAFIGQNIVKISLNRHYLQSLYADNSDIILVSF